MLVIECDGDDIDAIENAIRTQCNSEFGICHLLNSFAYVNFRLNVLKRAMHRKRKHVDNVYDETKIYHLPYKLCIRDNGSSMQLISYRDHLDTFS
jgi:hypothetical protein